MGCVLLIIVFRNGQWLTVNGKFCLQSTVPTFAAGRCHHQCKCPACREEEGGVCR